MHKTDCSLLGALLLSQVSMLEGVGSYHQDQLFPAIARERWFSTESHINEN